MKYPKMELEILHYLYERKQTPSGQLEKYHAGISCILEILVGYKYQSLINKCSNLKKRGLIAKSPSGDFYITWKGIDYIESVDDNLLNLDFKNKPNLPKTLLVIYDIPEESKKEREWFRKHLKKLDFEMIQKSVWVGPSPLPKEFLEYVKEIGIEKTFKTFKLSKSYKT